MIPLFSLLAIIILITYAMPALLFLIYAFFFFIRLRYIFAAMMPLMPCLHYFDAAIRALPAWL